MKKLFVMLLLLIFCNTSFAIAIELTGFLGIKFGASQLEVKKAMLNKKFKFKDSYKINETNQSSFFDGNVFAGMDIVYIMFLFHNNKYHTATVVFEPKLKSQIQNVFNDIKEVINKKYYESDYYKNFKTPYYEGDGYEEQAIELGYCSISAYWTQFDKNTISLEVDEDMRINLTYQDNELKTKQIEELKAEQSKDI